MLSFLCLQPNSWRQAVMCYPRQDLGNNGDALKVSMYCTPTNTCEILLRNGAKLRDYSIHLSILKGQLPPGEVPKLKPKALGGLWYVENQDFVHGFFCLRPQHFDAAWDQITHAGSSTTLIDLGVDPIEEDSWRENPLSIVSAEISFTRMPVAINNQATPPKTFWKRLFD